MYTSIAFDTVRLHFKTHFNWKLFCQDNNVKVIDSRLLTVTHLLENNKFIRFFLFVFYYFLCTSRLDYIHTQLFVQVFTVWISADCSLACLHILLPRESRTWRRNDARDVHIVIAVRDSRRETIALITLGFIVIERRGSLRSPFRDAGKRRTFLACPMYGLLLPRKRTYIIIKE